MHRSLRIRLRRLGRLLAVGLLASAVAVVGRADPATAVEHPPSLVSTWGTHGTGDGQFDGPAGVAIDPTTGDIYVTDTENHRVQKFDADGTFLAKWGTEGTGDGQFGYPEAVAVDPTTGDVYIADSWNHRVQKFDADGTFLTTWGTIGFGDGQFVLPQGVAVNPTTRDVYVTADGRVQKFDTDGTFLTSWGTPGTSNGPLGIPFGVAVDPTTGDVYVTDALNGRVQKFDADGTFLTRWGTSGSANSQFDAPFGVAVDPTTGDVYVTDLNLNRVQRFDAEGTFLTKWGIGRFSSPFGVAVDGEGDVYVADIENARVQEFGYRGRPDARLRHGGALVGNDIYNTTGIGQTRAGRTVPGHRVTYTASIQNDARFAERLRLRGQASTPNFTVRYYNPAGQNISHLVRRGTFRTPVLAPEGRFRITIVVTVLRTAPRGNSVTRTLTATSVTYPTVEDTVRFITGACRVRSCLR